MYVLFLLERTLFTDFSYKSNTDLYQSNNGVKLSFFFSRQGFQKGYKDDSNENAVPKNSSRMPNYSHGI